jgi:superfamily I DNA/RNA helicase
MDSLKEVVPTPEQRKLVVNTRPMNRIIRGAAGSGKTTTALFLLKIGIIHHKIIKQRTGDLTPVRAVVFTFNKTLSAYVEELALSIGEGVDVEVVHLSKYMRNKYPDVDNCSFFKGIGNSMFNLDVGIDLPLSRGELVEEVDYILGRYIHGEFDDYINSVGNASRGRVRLTVENRRDIVNEIVIPYFNYKSDMNVVDFNDFSNYLACNVVDSFDVAVVDECQDFSANELRAVVKQLHSNSFGTFIIDSVQKIYRRSFTWRELGLVIRPENSFRLETNYRNTQEIASFALSLLEGSVFDDDGTLPNNSSCIRSGDLPKIIIGNFSQQVGFVLNYINNYVDLASESVAFVHRKGGGYFDYLRDVLTKNDLDFCELTGASVWPIWDVNIALSTIHSVKGLEFDYVFMIGLDDNLFDYENEDDDFYKEACRLVSMGITRAKKGVVLGFKNEQRPLFVDSFDVNTYEEIHL